MKAVPPVRTRFKCPALVGAKTSQVLLPGSHLERLRSGGGSGLLQQFAALKS